ncbi:MAG: double-strand break repair helicase AddA [Alphaproteobacteria bacterium]|nr:double-strand break repair helicase AddA [Alphaproteobacteria bacterium]
MAPADKQPQNDNDPSVPQRHASDPKASVWVTASAGSGKTKVLTDRTLRLMLDGVEPDQLLCLTFTKAAAAVMTIRIRDELSIWASCPEPELKKRLKNLTGETPDTKQIRKARKLFTAFLDADGGAQIQTIHAFAQKMLHRFPIESGIPPYFDVMDDQTAADMLRQAQADVLRRAQDEPDTPLAKAVRIITPEVAEDDFNTLINTLTARRGQLLAIFADQGGVDQTTRNVYNWLGTPEGLTGKNLIQQLNSAIGINGRAPDFEALNNAADILATGSDTDRERATIIKAWLLNPETREDIFTDYAATFLKADGTPRKSLATKKAAFAEPALRIEAERLVKGLDTIATANLAENTESLLRLTAAILENYEARKRAHNLLDFDDLVHRANRMMREDHAGAWILQKLPGDLKHILIDEAQDTNPDQWHLVSAIAQEFFKGPTVKNAKDRTIFAVGDEKQSIFSFQRADPKEFENRRRLFGNLVNEAGGDWREVELRVAFRSSPAVTEAVDAVFDNPEATDGLFIDSEGQNKKVRHTPFRTGQAGLVELHPLIRPKEKMEPEPWSLPLTREDAPHPAADLADNIADKIKGWLDKGEKLESRGRAISPADIMILVRRRTEFVDHMISALKKRDIPVAGADRMALRTQIAVMDLTALGDCLLFPKDDYKLACVLKSPLVGMNDTQLEEIAARRKDDLWSSLATKAAEDGADPLFKEAHSYLEELKAHVNDKRPYEFYANVLTDACPAGESGMAAIYSRLGAEAEDPVTEFLNAAERFSKNHVPTLQGFLSWLEAGEAEVKREISLNPDAPRVHIMTTHGAKGLEAPIVILPDTTGVPADNARTRPRFLWPDEGRPVPLWAPRKDLENDVFRQQREKAEKDRDREYRRLLYVAMTRAADRLYVFGHHGERKLDPQSWYGLIEKGFKEKLTHRATQDKNGVIRLTVPQTAAPVPDGMKPATRRKKTIVPAWAKSAPKTAAPVMPKFTPSAAMDRQDVPAARSPLDDHHESYLQKLGTIVHSLFEFLPDVENDKREEAAKKYLSKPAWKLTPKEQERTLKSVLATLNDPEFGTLFGNNSLPEVSIAGYIEHDGRKEMMNGQIDRLVVDGDTVLIVDYKNSRRVPKATADIDEKHIIQMAAYRLAVQQIYPDKNVKCALLYTRKAQLMPLATADMDAACQKAKIAAYQPPPPRKKGNNAGPKH